MTTNDTLRTPRKRRKRIDNQLFGKNVRVFRLINDLKQSELAQTAKISTRTLSDVENGLRAAKEQEREIMAEALGIPLEILEHWDKSAILHHFNSISPMDAPAETGVIDAATKALYEQYIADLKQDKADLRAEVLRLRTENARLVQSEAGALAELRMVRAEKRAIIGGKSGSLGSIEPK